MRFSLSWNSLHKLYASLIGKAVFLMGLVTPIVKLSSIGVDLPNYRFFLAGSIFITIGFILEKIFAPSIIVNFSNFKEYIDYLLKLQEKKAFDYRLEFSLVDDFKDKNKLLNLAGFDKELESHFPISQALNLLGNNKFVYFAGKLNYLIASYSSPWLRVLCTGFFFIGSSLIYTPLVLNIFDYYGVF